MAFLTKKHLTRRTVLRGLGATVSLPLLDAMFPAFTAIAKAQARPRTRFGTIYIANGAIMEQWIPDAVGSGFAFKPILAPIEPFKDQVVVVTNLTRSHPGSQVGDHAVSAAGFLTGVWPKRTEAEDVLANTTVDQIVAQQIGQETPFPSLEVATEDFTGYVGACSPGFNCAYLNTVSWSSPSTPLPMDIDPRVVFERMFGQGGSPAQRAARMRDDRSMLDSITAEAKQLQRGLGNRDRQRVTEYLDNLREIERRIQQAEAHNRTDVTLDVPVGVPDAFEDHVGLMYDLLAVAYQADITRVFSFMLTRELSQRTYQNIGVTEQHHTVSHHGNDPQKIAQNVKVNTYHMRLFAKFLEKLKATPDGDGSLLDHSLIFYGGGMGNPNGHASDPLPVVAVGGGVGKGHRHIEVKKQTPVGNLWLAVSNHFGSKIETFGDSNGRVEGFFA
ncbi:MAG TPA: DUF1552 domain-containing protein [Vicinamibacterales bacterium]|nr:DUF1552 domain-containing protein [Vicinamibacterales bacterium]